MKKSSVNSHFTGNRDVDFLILHLINDKDLLSFSQVNKYTKNLCKNENFWKKRYMKCLNNKYPKPEWRSWKRHYLLTISPPRKWVVDVTTYDSYDSRTSTYEVFKNAAEVVNVGDITSSVIRENRLHNFHKYNIYDSENSKRRKRLSSKESAVPYKRINITRYGY